MTPSRTRRLVWPLLVGLAGCDSARPAVPAPAATTVLPAAPDPQPGRPTADKPDLLRLGYDPAARTLTLYDLPDRGGRWVLVTPDHPTGTPVSGTYAFAEDAADPDRVSVFYTVPDRRPSPPVTLREIADAHTLRASR